MDDLKTYRKKIDDIDKKLVELFEMRLDIVKEIEKIKFQNKLQVINKFREVEVIDNSIKNLKNKDYDYEIKKFMEKIIEISTNMQKNQ